MVGPYEPAAPGELSAAQMREFRRIADELRLTREKLAELEARIETLEQVP